MLLNLREKVFSSTIANKAIINSGWLIIEKITNLSIGFIVGVLLARYLGPDYYGKISYALAYIAFFQAITLLGLDAIVVRDLSNPLSNPARIINSVFTVRLIVAFICTVLAIGIANLFLKSNALILSIISMSIIFSIGTTFDLWFQSQSKSKLTVFAKLATYIFSAITKLIMIYMGMPIESFVLIVSIEFLLFSIVLYLLIKNKYKRIEIKLEIDKKYIMSALNESWPFILSGISIIIFMRSNIAFIETFLGMKSVGIYSVGANLAEMSYFLPMVLVTSFSPILARLRYEAPLKYTIFYKRLLFSMWWGSILIVLSFGALMYIALPYIYGERFEQSKYIFAIQLMTLIPVCMGLGQSIWIINEKKSKIFLIQTVIGAFIAILLSYFLIKNYGIIGAPISTLISQLIQALFLNFFLYRELFNITFKSLIWR